MWPWSRRSRRRRANAGWLSCAPIPTWPAKLAIRGELTPASTAEQASARLDACTIEEYDRFQALNAEYTRKFGFPFIMAVRGRNRPEILAAFEQRVHNEPETEFRTALNEVHKIALLRLGDL